MACAAFTPTCLFHSSPRDCRFSANSRARALSGCPTLATTPPLFGPSGAVDCGVRKDPCLFPLWHRRGRRPGLARVLFPLLSDIQTLCIPTVLFDRFLRAARPRTSHVVAHAATRRGLPRPLAHVAVGSCVPLGSLLRALFYLEAARPAHFNDALWPRGTAGPTSLALTTLCPGCSSPKKIQNMVVCLRPYTLLHRLQWLRPLQYITGGLLFCPIVGFCPPRCWSPLPCRSPFIVYAVVPC